MPYIIDERRFKNESDMDANCGETAGELNYGFTCMIKAYLLLKGESYQTYNDIMGALEGAKLELYRRKIAPYEDKKINENGDVY